MSPEDCAAAEPATPATPATPAEYGAVAWQPAETAGALGAECVHLWRICMSGDQPAQLREERWGYLSEDERERAERLKFEEHRGKFILCRAAMRTILGRYLGCAPGEIGFVYEEHGKPVVCTSPGVAGEASLRFNLSHSEDWALLGVTRERRIGVDIEKRRTMKDMGAVAVRFFSEAESGKYLALPSGEREKAFFHCWTRKEAFIKAIGEGLSRPLSSFEVTLGPDEPPRLVRVNGHTGEEARWMLYSFEPAPGYTAALMVERERNRLGFWEINDSPNH